MAGVTHFDLAGLVVALRRAVAAFDAGTATQIDQALEQISQAIGLDIERDLLRSLGDEWAYYVDPSVAGNGIADATLVNRLRSPAKAEGSLDKLEKFINALVESQLAGEKPKMSIAFRQAKFDQTTVHYLGLPLLEPAWAVADGNLYIALYPEVVATAAKHVSAKGQSIVDNPDFVNLRNSRLSLLDSLLQSASPVHSRQNRLHHVPLHIRQSEIPSLKFERQFPMIESEAMKQRGLQVVDVDGVLGDVVAEVVGLAVGEAGFDAAACKPDGEAAAVVVAAVSLALMSPWPKTVRPNSPAQTINVSSNRPRCLRSLTSAAEG